MNPKQKKLRDWRHRGRKRDKSKPPGKPEVGGTSAPRPDETPNS